MLRSGFTVGVLFSVTAPAPDGGWALVAGSARQRFASDRHAMVRTTRAGGVVMAGLRAGLAVEAVRG